MFPSASVMKIVKATEVMFRQSVIEQSIGVSAGKNLFGRIIVLFGAVWRSPIFLSQSCVREVLTSQNSYLCQKV